MIEKMITVSIKDAGQPIHWHDLLEINLVLSGEMDVVRNNRTFRVREGELMVLNRDDVHSIASGSEDLLYVQMHFNMQEFNQYIPDIWTVLVYCSPEDNDAVQRNLKAEIKSHISNIVRLMNEQSNNIDAEKAVIYYCIDILSSFKMAFGAFADSKACGRNEEQENRLWKIIDYIYDHHNQKLTLSEVARQVYVSDDYLSKILKRYTGRGFEDFVGSVRTEMSIRLLLNTDKSITDIAYECGFSAPKYYNAAFEKNYGCRPVVYRRANIENFRIEKQQEAATVIFEEGVDVARALELVGRYTLEWATDSTAEEINVDISDLKNSGEVMTRLRLPKTFKGEILNYNMQRELSDVQLPCVKICDEVIAWQERGATKVLIVNPDKNIKRRYIVRFTQLQSAETYIYCRAKTPEIPQSIRKLANTGDIARLNRDIIDNMYNMTYEYGEVSDRERIFMNMELDGEQLAKIILQKV